MYHDFLYRQAGRFQKLLRPPHARRSNPLGLLQAAWSSLVPEGGEGGVYPGTRGQMCVSVERAVIMSTGRGPHLPSGEAIRKMQGTESASIRTLAEAERDHILDVLHQVAGVVGGRNGAASRLGLPRTTLLYRMRKLGIRREESGLVGNA